MHCGNQSVNFRYSEVKGLLIGVNGTEHQGRTGSRVDAIDVVY